jgi:putative Ca2+/H+ antiporter (TMEM165/GDT1 family)
MTEVTTKKSYILSAILFVCGVLSITTSFYAALMFMLAGASLLPGVLAKVKRKKLHYFSIAVLVIAAIAMWSVDSSIEADRKIAKQEAKEKRMEEARKNASATSSGSYVTEDPRNIYLYCIGSTTTCYTTPAECNSNKVYYSGAACVPVACGTAAAIGNSRLCQKKGF